MYSKLHKKTKLALLKFVSAFPEIDSLNIFLPQVLTSTITFQRARTSDIRDRRLFQLPLYYEFPIMFNSDKTISYVFNLLGIIPEEVRLITLTISKNNKLEEGTEFLIANPTPKNIEKEILKLERGK